MKVNQGFPLVYSLFCIEIHQYIVFNICLCFSCDWEKREGPNFYIVFWLFRAPFYAFRGACDGVCVMSIVNLHYHGNLDVVVQRWPGWLETWVTLHLMVSWQLSRGPATAPPDPNSVLQKYCQYLVCWCKLASIDGRENGRWQEAKATICDRPRCLCGQRQPVASAHHPPCCWDQLGLQGDDGECKEAVDNNGESYGGDAARWPRPWARSHGESFLQDLFFFQCKLICYVSRIERQEYIWLYPAQYLNMVKAWHLNPV